MWATDKGLVQPNPFKEGLAHVTLDGSNAQGLSEVTPDREIATRQRLHTHTHTHKALPTNALSR
jgi:hypothetical protein